MPYSFRVKATIEATGEVEEQTGEFADADWARLQSFVSCAHRLAACRFAESQRQLHFRIKGDAGKPVEFEATFPPEDDIAAFLHFMRPFMLAEPTNFHGIRGLIGRYITLPQLRGYLKRLGKLYDGSDIPFDIEVSSTSGRVELKSAKAVDTWLNAFEYHQDSDKQDALRGMYSVFPAETSRVMFLYVLLQRAGAIGKLAALVEGFAHRDGREVRTNAHAT